MITLYKNDVATVLDDKQWQEAQRTYPLLYAAGGVVRNPNGELLMMIKRGKWDLPKGTIEPDESPEHCALREVEEECSVNGLIINAFRATTYHTYVETDGVEYLKQTRWYDMQCDNCRAPRPQAEEDITTAVWASPQEVAENLKNAYGSVKELLIT
jgi:8-oxo-dGTP pyrophosphatase MutT (NUDIX family)